MGDQDMKSSTNESATLFVNKEQNLQHRYTSLHEKRIAQLEAIIESSAKRLDEATVNKDNIVMSNSKIDAKNKNSKANNNGLVEIINANNSNTSTESEKGDVAFTLRRVLDPDDPATTYSEIDMKDDALRELLKEIIGSDYPGQNFDGDPVNITAPFPSLCKQISKFKEKLQLDDRHKLMIQALIDEHEGRAEIKDVVEDKGKGLVLLLHAIDIAVQSRIHLAIRYDDFDQRTEAKRIQIFLDQLEPESIKDKESILAFINEWGSEYKLNGRQIWNVMSSALSLARSLAKERDRDGRLTERHLKQMLTITKDFQEQLETITMDTRNANEAARSRK